MTDINSNKQLILDYFAAVEKSTSQNITETVSQFIADDYHWYGVYPFEEQSDAQGVADAFWKPFLDAWSPISRRQDVFMGGTSEIDGSQWVTSMGFSTKIGWAFQQLARWPFYVMPNSIM
ncbi:hypothetical protein OAT92_08190 [Porticoccaceae bacterium]|nr:hypothetical protein [Porticoccaceae bacterium]